MIKTTRQLKLWAWAPEPEARPETPTATPRADLAVTGFPIDPDHVITSLDDAIEKLGRELGRLGTLLDHLTDYTLLGNFSQLYAQNLTRYADLLLKQKALAEEPNDALLDVLSPALDRLNEKYKLDL